MDELTSSFHLGNAGVPDRLVVLPDGKIGFAEMKRPGEVPRKLQERQMRFLNKLGFIAEVIDSEEAMEQFIKKLENQVKL